MKLGSLKQWLAVFLVIVVSLLSGYHAFFMNPPKVLTQDDGAAKWEERMKAIREYLPPSVHEVGYVSDNETTAMIQEYSLTKYALAPIIVRQNTDFEWIVGNFTQPGFESMLDQKIPKEFTIKNFGAGIYLIHRTLP